MVTTKLKLSDVTGAPARKLLDVATTRNQFLNAVEKFPHSTALVCFSETEALLDGLDWSQLHDIVPNGLANGHTNGYSNSSDLAHKTSKYLRLTYSQLYAASLRFATALHASGIKDGDIVSTVMYTGAEVSIVAWATFLLGAIWLPLHPRTAANAKELNHVFHLTKPAAVVAYDGDVAANIDQNPGAHEIRVKIVTSAGSRKGWSTWRDMLSNTNSLLHMEPDTDKNCENKYTMIVFTSGTTSLPKAAAHNNLNLATTCANVSGLVGWGPHSIVHQNFPFHHIGGNSLALSAWAVGASVVIPAMAFSPAEAVQAMRAEPPTDLCLLPAMMFAMQEYDPRPFEHDHEKLLVLMSATTILREHYISARRYFNATHFGGPYGASEGLPCAAEAYNVKDFDPPPGPINPGRPVPGVRIKVCAQGTRDPLPVHEIGELHQSGSQVIPGYLKQQTEEFYTDEDGVAWFASGDAAVMDDTGSVGIVGRVKDMIIRGGENISPAQIEDVVNKLPGVDVSVVAAADAISGEVPVAVLRYTNSDKSTTSTEIRELVLKELGPTFALSEVIPLEQLGLSDWPKTSTGKVRKVDLRSLVKNYMDEKETEIQPSGQQDLTETLKEIWSQVLGLPTSKLSLDTDLRDLADSLTTMQFRARVSKRLGKNISLQQLLIAFTIAEQAKVLEELQSAPSSRSTLVIKRDGAPQLDDVSFVDDDEDHFERVKEITETQLAKLGLTWSEDVEDLIPIWDWGKVEGRPYRPKSMTHRHAFVSDNLSKNDLRQNLEKTIDVHPIIRSLGAQEGQGDDRFLVILRASKKYFANCIHDAGTVEKASDLAQLCLKDTQGNTSFPGLLFKIILADIRETNTAGFIFISQHTIFDAGSLGLFFENFQLILNGSSPLERTSYKAWADMYYNNRTSAKATQGVKARVALLKSVSSLKKALWPPTKAPGFYFGDDWQWVDPDSMKPGDPSQRPCEDTDQNVCTGIQERGLTIPYDQGVTCAFELPGLFNLQQAHGIHPVTLVQTSLALANMYLTKQPFALLTLANGGRAWPFIQPEIAEVLPEPVDIDGPMVELIPHVIRLTSDESTVEFLQKLQREQQSLSKYAHAPLLRIKEELGSEDGDMMMEMIRHQVFNWLPMIGTGMALEGFRHVQKTHHNDFMVTWAAGMPDAETVVVHTDVDRAQLTVKEVQRAQNILEQAALWMCNEQNWGRPVAEFLSLKL